MLARAGEGRAKFRPSGRAGVAGVRTDTFPILRDVKPPIVWCVGCPGSIRPVPRGTTPARQLVRRDDAEPGLAPTPSSKTSISWHPSLGILPFLTWSSATRRRMAPACRRAADFHIRAASPALRQDLHRDPNRGGHSRG